MSDNRLIQNAEALSHYIDDLMRQAGNWQEAMAAVDQQIALLADAWEDEMFRNFLHRVRVMKGKLEGRIPEIEAQQAVLHELERKVRRIENIQ